MDFYKKIVDRLFDKFVAFSNKIVDLLVKLWTFYLRGGSSAPREPPGYGPEF